MKHLFHLDDDKNGAYNDEGAALQAELHDVINPIIKKAVDNGYSRPEVEAICHDVIFSSITFTWALRNAE